MILLVQNILFQTLGIRNTHNKLAFLCFRRHPSLAVYKQDNAPTDNVMLFFRRSFFVFLGSVFQVVLSQKNSLTRRFAAVALFEFW